MTAEETGKILGVIFSLYPNFKVEDKVGTIRAWQMILEPYNYKDINIALVMYTRSNTSGFAPSPGQLIGKLESINDLGNLQENEAWSLVEKALKNGTYGYKEEFEKLPPAVQRAVGHAENLRAWANCDSDTVSTVIYSQFVKAYKKALQSDREWKQLPPQLRQALVQKKKSLLPSREPVEATPMLEEWEKRTIPDWLKERRKNDDNDNRRN